MDSKDQNLDLTRMKRIHFCLFQSIFVCWDVHCSVLCYVHNVFLKIHSARTKRWLYFRILQVLRISTYNFNLPI